MTADVIRPLEILVVDDSPADARLAAETLKERDFNSRLYWAADGQQAIEFLRRQAAGADAPYPDLILLDLNLPGRDGREVLADLKGDPLLRRIPVVIMTASPSEVDRNRCYDLHANCYITKPPGWQEFAEVIRSIGDLWLARAGQGAGAGPATF